MKVGDMQGKCEIGMVGLGVMGCNLLLNMADQGFTVAGYDKDIKKVDALRQQVTEHNIHAFADVKDFIAALARPRAIMLLVPAGAAVDAVIAALLPYLQADDLIIDAGNSYFKDSDTRAQQLAEKNIRFLSVGISGGEEGARHGPSIMPSGPKAAYQRVAPILEAIAAKVDKDPCVTYLGPGSAGHFVKMVHNGIEYGIMQLIAESYALLKRGLKLDNEKLSTIYGQWNASDLNGYLMEITSHIFAKIDDKTGKSLIDEVRAVAKQNGTGMWTSKSAMELQLPTPTIDLAVAMRDLSVFVAEREQASSLYQTDLSSFNGEPSVFIAQLQNALFTGILTAYAQGMALLSVASVHYEYHLNLEAVARIWRGGCIIRAALLEDIRKAFVANPDLANLLLDADLAAKVLKNLPGLREVVCQATKLGIPIPSLSVSLSYLDALTDTHPPANLIQAQRDYFGSHTYQRIDMEGTFHTEWENN
mgnify:CR=1 FL=1